MNHSVRVGAVCFQEYPGDYSGFLDLAAELGLSWVELKFEPPICLKEGSISYDKIKKKAETLGIGLSLHTPFVGLNIGSIHEEERQESLRRIKESLTAAGKMGITYATVHAGYLRSEEYSKYNWEKSIELNILSLKELAVFGKNLGVTLCMENGNAFKKNFLKQALHPGEMKYIRSELSKAGVELKFTVDFGHAMYFSLNPSYLISELGLENVKLSHLHSNFQLDDTHNPLGEGYLELCKVIESYKREKWNFPLSIEMKSEDNLRKSVKVLNSCLKKKN
ncbi:MAG: sugar phosphate isomerase/epimerase [Spirochaetaceae bacterium]|nr:sugar phosphate isomerase/epimerase [Spirochaetaceae bacterium]